ncbi:MAG: type II toxin-antitoxin system Phd/YefM family antitoxin [Proteobacteria bacterium]|nr:type II toxin-antitoxin system Phd/YefM family antitoxin [Pseudomonadota bacterium]
MTLKINVHEAKTHFSRFLDRVGNGEEIIIAKAGKPIARLLPLHRKAGTRTPGSARGKVKISEDFDAPLPATVLKEFEK